MKRHVTKDDGPRSVGFSPRVFRDNSLAWAKAHATARPPRSGWTLIELLVVTSLTLLIAGSATVLMSKMLRASHVQADTLVRQRTLHLWECQFRQDGRLAQSAKVIAEPPDKVSVEFQLPSGPVTYQVIPGGLERRVQGELGGRWECGSGEWSFMLLEGTASSARNFAVQRSRRSPASSRRGHRRCPSGRGREWMWPSVRSRRETSNAPFCL